MSKLGSRMILSAPEAHADASGDASAWFIVRNPPLPPLRITRQIHSGKAGVRARRRDTIPRKSVR
jgi:hypothetical protein